MRYSLRAIFALVLIAAAFFAWVYHEVQLAKAQRLAVEAILAYGGEVTFNGSTTVSSSDLEANAQLPPPTWWTEILGEDPRLRVTHVVIHGRTGSSQGIGALLELITSSTNQSGEIKEFEGELELVFGGGQTVHEDDDATNAVEQPPLEFVEASPPEAVAAPKPPEPKDAEPSPGDQILERLSHLRGLEQVEIDDPAISEAALQRLRARCPNVIVKDKNAPRPVGFGGGIF